jgi:hypothetical protein
MHRVKSAASILLLITAPLLTATGQDGQTKKTSPDKPSARTSENTPAVNPTQRKIFAALDQVLESQKTFADENLRAVIQAHVADMLWSYDEPRARRLFDDALQLAERSTFAQPSQAQGTPARAVVIQLIMRRDSDWATKLVESAGELANVDPKARNSREYRERVSLQLQLGLYFIQQDPQRAPRVAKAFADNGDVNSLLLLLGMIRSRDASAADELFVQALAKAKLGQTSFEDINKLARYLFPSFGEGVLFHSSNVGQRDPFTPVSTDSAAVEQFLDLAYDVVTKRLNAAMTGTDGTRLNARSILDYAIPKLLLPYFDRFTADKAPALRARLQQALHSVPPEDRQYLMMTESGSVQELISRASAIADVKIKDILFLGAIRQAIYGGDIEQASAIIERLSEGARSNARSILRQTMDQKRSEQAWSALDKGDFDKAEALVAELSDWRSDPLLLRSLVGRLAQKDKPRASRVLDQYERLAAGIENPIERTLRLMELAGIAANIDMNRGFDEMKLAFLEFNRAGFVPELQKYRDDAGTGRVSSVNIGLSGLINDWNLQWLGRTDFDRALVLTQQFQMREATALMQLAVCRGALGKFQPAPVKVSQAPDATQRKALAQLDQLLKQSKSFEDTEVRIRIQAQIADLLWESDEQRARALFAEAFKEIASAKLPEQDKSIPPSYVGSDSHFPIRSDLIRLVSERDPSLAAKLIDSVVDQPPNVDPKFLGSGYGKYSESDMLKFQFAMSITRSDPERAAKIAGDLLRKADFHRAISILQSLRGTDATRADDMFVHALSQAKQTGVITAENIRTLADYVFSGFGEGVIRFTTGAPRQGPSESIQVSPALTAQFMELAYDAIEQWTSAARQSADSANSRANGRDRSEFTVAKLLLPFFDQHMPDKAAGIRARVNEAFDKTAGGDFQNAVTRPSTVEDLLSRSDKLNPNEKSRIYSEAIFQAIQSRHLEEARTILERVEDEGTRSHLVLMLQRATEEERYRNAQEALDRGDFDVAYELIEELGERLQVNMLSNMALSLFNKKENARALKVLDEAERRAAKGEDRTDRASEMLHLAGVAARLDPNRGFEDMKLAVEAINHADPAPQWQKLETATDSKSGITTRKNTGLAPLAGMLFNSGFSVLSRADFDRILMLAKAIEMKEVSALAQIAVCRAVLKSPARVR